VRTNCRRAAILGVVVACAAACARHENAAPVVAAKAESTRKPQIVPPDGIDAFRSAAAACDWLVRHQSADGCWNLRGPGGCGDARCSTGDGPADVVGDTSLAVFALLSASTSWDSSRFGMAMRSGFAYLQSAQRPDGSFDAASGTLDHALATEAFAWMLARTPPGGTAERRCRSAMERALARLLALRTPGAAWSDGAVGTPCDLRVTTWATFAVAEARGQGLDVPADLSRDVLSWLDADPGGPSESAAAMRTCCRLSLGATQRDPHMIADHEILTAFDAAPEKDGKASDALGRYFVTLAESRWGGAVWARRRTTGNGAVLPLQRRESDGCICGSWDPDGAGGPEGDRVGATALTAMLFDACFISTYANVMREQEPQIPK
jgi:hypothetical protein